MVLEVFLGLLAHGADPRPISWDEATANLFKFFGTVLLVVLMSYPVLAPLFPPRESGDATGEGSTSSSGLIGWLGLGLLLVLSMAWWLTRTSLVELSTQETPMPDHAHIQERGGQVAMWGDFHAEVARIESGEVRVYLTDSYNRPISARFFGAEILSVSPGRTIAPSEPSAASGQARGTATPVPAAAAGTAVAETQFQTLKRELGAESHPTIPALDESYRFARLDRASKEYRVRVTTPGWAVTLKFEFGDSNGRRSLPIWCGTPN